MSRDALMRFMVEYPTDDQLYQFVLDVALRAIAAEREACAQLVERAAYAHHFAGELGPNMTTIRAAEAIRARSKEQPNATGT